MDKENIDWPDQIMISVDDEGWFACQFTDGEKKPVWKSGHYDKPQDALNEFLACVMPEYLEDNIND